MSSARREVFLSKVLTRLYPDTDDLRTVPSKNETVLTGSGERTKAAICPPITEPAELKFCKESRFVKFGSLISNTHETIKSNMRGIEKSNLSQLKVYTASLPPDDYIPPAKSDLKPSSTEDSELEEMYKRRRRKKKKLKFVNEATSEREENTQQTPQPPQESESRKINKNKKRKLQRKRQKQRLKAEGLWTKGRSCQSDVWQTDGNNIKESDEQTEDDLRKKREDLLEFLQATQELYFSDSKSRCAASAVMVDQMGEVLEQIRSGAAPSSEVQLLHHLRSRLLLQDIERFNNSLDGFKAQSSMPLDHIEALCSLFDYWITNILPIKTKPTE
ncbi:glutamate-rich protein 1 isoform X2 [Dendropsophus ebraccatus]|uniref:glutamate-rich protein 1 isoform X2 n=1 Tax=Dendropsophus ebraccatus TaxID=150705 RepID=UPI0038319511